MKKLLKSCKKFAIIAGGLLFSNRILAKVRRIYEHCSYGILSRHNLCATGTTGKLIAEATGLNIVRFLSGSQGGDQQIGARIACNEIDLLLIFRDPLNPKPHEPKENNLLRLCDVHNIPVATNIATAEAIIHSLERGDLDWRDIVNPK